MYEKLSLINSQFARGKAYTWDILSKRGFKDALWLELGLFANKEQKEMSRWLYGTKPKVRTKLYPKNQQKEEQRQIENSTKKSPNSKFKR